MAQVSLPYTLTAGTPENVNNLVANLNALVAGVNTIDTAQLASGSVSQAKLAAGVYVPIGGIVQFGGSTAPSNWLICNGDAVSRTTYADLFTALSTSYGSGDGSTTFNLPDLRGRMAVGKGTNADIDALGENEGMSDVQYRRPKHRHTLVGQVFSDTNNGAYFKGSAGNLGTTPTNLYIGSDTADRPLDAPAYLVVNYIIRAL